VQWNQWRKKGAKEMKRKILKKEQKQGGETKKQREEEENEETKNDAEEKSEAERVRMNGNDAWRKEGKRIQKPLEKARTNNQTNYTGLYWRKTRVRGYERTQQERNLVNGSGNHSAGNDYCSIGGSSNNGKNNIRV